MAGAGAACFPDCRARLPFALSDVLLPASLPCPANFLPDCPCLPARPRALRCSCFATCAPTLPRIDASCSATHAPSCPTPRLAGWCAARCPPALTPSCLPGLLAAMCSVVLAPPAEANLMCRCTAAPHPRLHSLLPAHCRPSRLPWASALRAWWPWPARPWRSALQGWAPWWAWPSLQVGGCHPAPPAAGLGLPAAAAAAAAALFC